jgi:D-alanyl-D-alanine dipeptidase
MSIAKASLGVLLVCAWGAVSAGAGELVLVQQAMPDLMVDLRYAGPRNITGRAFYPDQRAWLRPEAVRQLKVVQSKLRRQGLQLILWDAYRSPAAHLELWKVMPNPNFVASPRLGSRHSRGTTVDVGLADLRGRPVEVPTDHDVFGPLADHDLSDVSERAARHVEILRRAMFDSGWSGVPAEWWHYDLRDWKKYPVIDNFPE